MCGTKVCTKTIVYEAVIPYSQHTIWHYYNCEMLTFQAIW